MNITIIFYILLGIFGISFGTLMLATIPTAGTTLLSVISGMSIPGIIVAGIITYPMHPKVESFIEPISEKSITILTGLIIVLSVALVLYFLK